MQRYDPIDLGNGCLPHEMMEHSLDGNYVLAEEAQAEITALHAECDRLTALIAPNTRPAIEQYNELAVEEPGFDAVEKLRFFCSLAMNGQDWLDVEPFFDTVTALLGKPKVLEAHEVTEPGYYWQFDKKFSEWAIAYITNDGGNDLIMRTAGADWFEDLEGKFIGPLPVPEV